MIVWSCVCCLWHYEHRLTLPYHPWTNWMVERANWTIKNNTIKTKVYENFDELSKDIKRFMYYYNIERRHWGIIKEWKWKTPYDAIFCIMIRCPKTLLVLLLNVEKKCVDTAYNNKKNVNFYWPAALSG